MGMFTGKVVGGKVVVEGQALEEGAIVTVLTTDDEDSFTLPEDQEAELQAALDEADRGDLLDADEVLKGLRERRKQA